jgi:hypothetical protein
MLPVIDFRGFVTTLKLKQNFHKIHLPSSTNPPPPPPLAHIMSPSTVAYDAKAERLSSIQSDTSALCVIHHQHANKFASYSHIICLHGVHAKELVNLKLQRQIKKEAVVIAEAAYKKYHDVSYYEFGYMESH